MGVCEDILLLNLKDEAVKGTLKIILEQFRCEKQLHEHPEPERLL